MQTLDRLTALRKSASHRKISAETPFLVRQLSFRSLRGHASCEDYSPESHLLTHCWGLSVVSTQSYCFFSRGRSELDSTTAPVTPVVASTPSDVEVIDLTGLTDSSESDGERDIDEEEELEGSGSDDGSEGSEIEITLNAETRAQLQTAIATVSETRLRHLLRRLVEAEVHVEALLTRELITLQRGTQAVVPRWDACLNCDQEFDINTIREETECVFHPGECVHFNFP